MPRLRVASPSDMLTDGPVVSVVTQMAGIQLGSLVSALCDLGRVERLDDLGKNGPLDASCGSHSSFNCLFGRDAIRMAMDLLDDFPRVAIRG